MEHLILTIARKALNSPLGTKYAAAIIYNGKIIGIGYNKIPYTIFHRRLKEPCLL